MRIVERAIARPNHCVVYPHLGQAHEDGYVDTGNELSCWDPHAYVSVRAVKDMARMLGWVSPQALERDAAALTAAVQRVEELEAQLEEKQKHLDSIDALESAGLRARRKTGRPSNKERQERAERERSAA